MEAYSIFVMILTSYFPHRWNDLSQYKLLILRTYQRFSGDVWLNYNHAFREHAAASRVTDWSPMNVQLYNFHAAGVAAYWRPGKSAVLPEPAGIALLLLSAGPGTGVVALPLPARTPDTCSAGEADQRAVCPGHAEKEVKTDPKHEASSSLLDGRSRHGGMDSKNFAPGGNLLKPFTMLQTSNSCLDMSNSQWNTSISSHQPHCYEFHNPHQLPCMPETIISMFCYLQDNLTSSSTVYWSPTSL